MSDDGLTVGNGDLTPPPVEAPIQETPVSEASTGSEEPTSAPSADAAPADKAIVPDWPDDWREKLAGNDEKALKRLGRFASPAGIFKSFRELEAKFSRGELGQ